MDKTKAQDQMVEFQMLQQQLELMQKYSEELDEKIAEFSKTKDSLQDMTTVKNNAELLVPIAQGIYAHVKAADLHQLVVNVGANTLVSKSIPHVIELIDKQITEVTAIKQKIEENGEKLAERFNAMLGEMQE